MQNWALIAEQRTTKMRRIYKYNLKYIKMLSALTANGRLHDKYTCNVCSALLNIRPVNVADMAYHYFLFSSPLHSLSLPLPTHTHTHKKTSPTSFSLHTLQSVHQFIWDEQAEEQPGRRFKHPGKMLCIHGNWAVMGLNAAFIPSDELTCLLPKAVRFK